MALPNENLVGPFAILNSYEAANQTNHIGLCPPCDDGEWGRRRPLGVASGH